MSSTVYALIDPTTNEARYVGVTALSLKTRLSGHCSLGTGKYSREWISDLKAKGIKPEIIPLEENIRPEDESASEVFWIAYLKGLGANLSNMMAGGKRRPPDAGTVVNLRLVPLPLHRSLKIAAINSDVSLETYIINLLAKDMGIK